MCLEALGTDGTNELNLDSQTRGNFNGDVWLGFERLTCVPIQTRMVKESMLTKEEKQWIKVSFMILSFIHLPRIVSMS